MAALYCGVPRIHGIPGAFHLFFYSFDCNEPVHVHVRRDRATAKFWLTPVVALADSHSFTPRDLNQVRDVILQYQDRILEAWYEHCGQLPNDRIP